MKRYDTYKDSGVQWIGEIPGHWEVVPLYGIITNWYKGQGITKEQVYEDGDTPCVRYGEIYSKYNLYFEKCVSKTNSNDIASKVFIHKGDILFAATGESVEEIGKSIVYLGDERPLVGGDVIVGCHEQNNKFMAYVLASQEVQNQKSWGKMKLKVVHISSNRLKRVVIPLPPLPEQESIVNYLDNKLSKIDAYVADKEREIDALEELKQTEIANIVTKGLNTNVPMKNSRINWIGEIPKHWEVKRLASIAYEHFLSNKKAHHQNLLSLSYGRIIRKDINKTDGLLPASFDNYQIVEPGNIVLRLTDLQNDHKSLRVGLVKEEGIVTSAYLAIACRNNIIPEYLYYQLHTNDIHKIFYGMGDGIRQGLNYDGIRKLTMVLPPLPEQNAIVAHIEKKLAQIDLMVSSLRQQIERLTELKQSIISDAVTGKIKI